MNNGITATVTSVIHAPLERVWKALVDPADIANYMMGARVTTSWSEGSAIRWQGEWKGKPYEDTGRVLKVREPELLSYTHNSTGSDGDPQEHIITIELKETAGVTHLRLTQDNNRTEEERQHAEKSWTLMLDELKKMLGEAPVAAPETART